MNYLYIIYNNILDVGIVGCMNLMIVATTPFIASSGPEDDGGIRK